MEIKKATEKSVAFSFLLILFLTENLSTFRPYRLQAFVVLQEREDLQ